MTEIQDSGIYIIRDAFFEKYGNNRYMKNKQESRPHYYAMAEKSGVLWMVPMSTNVDKYKRLIYESERRHGSGNCVHYLIAPIYGKDRAFIICDMFPVLPEHVLRPYNINNVPYVLENKNIKKNIRVKALAYLNMVERGVLHSPLNIIETKAALLKSRKN